MPKATNNATRNMPTGTATASAHAAAALGSSLTRPLARKVWQATGGLSKNGQFTNWYDAVRDSKRACAPIGILMTEDRTLLPFARRRMVGTARDLRRNFSVAAWAIRKHLDFVSTFTFHARTSSPDFNRVVEKQVVERWGHPLAFDAAGRHGLARFTRLIEASAVVDGDVGAIPLANGTLQAIEGDRIRTPLDAPMYRDEKNCIHGVVVNDRGRPQSYLVCKRTPLGMGFVFDREVSARYMLMHGYYDRFDQVRGVTPLSTSLNEMQDVYENRVYALMKSKAAQLFGIKITRSTSEALDLGRLASAPDTANGETGMPPVDRDYRGQMRKAYESFGVPILDFKQGEDAGFMENKTPSGEFQAFDKTMIASAIKSLDLPFSFYDESFTNFFGSKGALQYYLYGADIKRANLAAWLNRWTRWRMALAIGQDEFPLPSGIGWDDLAWEWVPTGLPWWRPLEEVKANQAAIAIGETSTPRVCKENGEDAYQIADEQADYEIYKAGKRKAVLAAGGRWPDEDPPSAQQPTSTETQRQDESARNGSEKP